MDTQQLNYHNAKIQDFEIVKISRLIFVYLFNYVHVYGKCTQVLIPMEASGVGSFWNVHVYGMYTRELVPMEASRVGSLWSVHVYGMYTREQQTNEDIIDL